MGMNAVRMSYQRQTHNLNSKFYYKLFGKETGKLVITVKQRIQFHRTDADTHYLGD